MEQMGNESLASSEAANAGPQYAVLTAGMRALMLGVLEEAIHSLRSPDSLDRAQAELWTTSRERRYVFSFVVICEALGLEPSAVRRSLIGLLDTKKTGRVIKRSRPNVRHAGTIRLPAVRGKAVRRAGHGRETGLQQTRREPAPTTAPMFRSRLAQPASRLPIPGANESYDREASQPMNGP